MHGSVEAVEKAAHYVENQDEVLSMIIAGDFASINYDRSDDNAIILEEQKIRKIFKLIENLGIPYFFVWGNRDSFFFMDKSSHNISPKRAAIQFLDSLALNNGICLYHLGVLPFLDEYKITCDPKLVDETTIYVTHWQRNVQSNALLHLEGHVHYGQLNGNYLNLCFLFRDSIHGAESLLGGIWQIELTKFESNFEYVDLGNNVKEMICPIHNEEGVFYVPKYWRKCPVCYDIDNAKFLSSISTSG